MESIKISSEDVNEMIVEENNGKKESIRLRTSRDHGGLTGKEFFLALLTEKYKIKVKRLPEFSVLSTCPYQFNICCPSIVFDNGLSIKPPDMANGILVPKQRMQDIDSETKVVDYVPGFTT